MRANVTKTSEVAPAKAPAEPDASRPKAPDSPVPPSPGGSKPAKDVPRTMRELRLARALKRKPERSTDKHMDNPLREGLRLERMPDPFVFVLFGGTGDLAHRKVIPALYQLWRTNLLPHEFMLIAIGRRPYSDESFRTEIKASLDKYSRVLPLDPQVWDEFAKRIDYLKADFNDPVAYAKLSKYLDTCDVEHGTQGNRLYYLATQPSAFPDIVGELGRAGLDHEMHGGGWRRIVIEKPFGRDLESAVRLNREVGKVFREKQVYRIDHYLGKETVRNLLVFRFGNGIFEPIWNRRYVDHVQITVAESIGIENRGAFYEETGAIRDFLQNHLMQLVSLVAMEPPASFDADALRDEKVKVLRADRRRRPGPRSRTTWCAASTARAGSRPGRCRAIARSRRSIRSPRPRRSWRPGSRSTTGAGPACRSTCAPASACPSARPRSRSSSGPCPTACSGGRARPGAEPAGDAHPARRGHPAALRGQGPGPGHRRPGREHGLHLRLGVQRRLARAYETLILDALLGDAALFTRADEVEEAWGIVTPIIEAWADGPPPDFPDYDAGTWGPRPPTRSSSRTAGGGGGSDGRRRRQPAA